MVDYNKLLESLCVEDILAVSMWFPKVKALYRIDSIIRHPATQDLQAIWVQEEHNGKKFRVGVKDIIRLLETGELTVYSARGAQTGRFKT